MALRRVEIQIRTFAQTTPSTETNEVGVVIPAMVTDLADEDEVEFVNATGADPTPLQGAGQAVSVWFPEEWYQSPDDNDKVLKKTIELAAPGDSEKRKLITVQVNMTPDERRELKYVVYCHGIKELAVGDSPPKMDIPPPP